MTNKYPLATKAGIYELCGHEQKGRPWCKDNPRCPGYTVNLDRAEAVLEAATEMLATYRFVAKSSIPSWDAEADLSVIALAAILEGEPK